MNPSTSYNPFASAAQAAIAELTSDQAKHFYTLQRKKNLQHTRDGVLKSLGWVYQLLRFLFRVSTHGQILSEQRPLAVDQLAISEGKNPLELVPEISQSTIPFPETLAFSGETTIAPLNEPPKQHEDKENVTLEATNEMPPKATVSRKPRNPRTTAKTNKPPVGRTSKKSKNSANAPEAP